MENTTYIIISIIAIILSPIIAVSISLWYQSYQSKRDAKLRLFITLMAHRKTLPPVPDFVNALNLIDVVFYKNEGIIGLWHEYYDLLHQEFSEKVRESWDHKYLELLSEIAKELGYKGLKQTDIDKFYSPIAHGKQYLKNQELQEELLRVLKNTSSMLMLQKDWKDKIPKDESQNSAQE